MVSIASHHWTRSFYGTSFTRLKPPQQHHSCRTIQRTSRKPDQNGDSLSHQRQNRCQAARRKRTVVKDAPMSPSCPPSTVLTAEQKARIVACRRQTLLPLDDCFYVLQPSSIPHLTRSSLHGVACNGTASADCRQTSGTKPVKKQFK